MQFDKIDKLCQISQVGWLLKDNIGGDEPCRIEFKECRIFVS
jgi:hypothetical protein